MALSVVTTSPHGQELDIPLNGYVKIDFNSEIGTTYFSDINVGNYFQLYEKAGFRKQGVVGGRVSGNNLSVFIKPLQALKPHTEYIFIILGGPNGVKNLLNEYLTTNFVVGFTTGGSVDAEDNITIVNNEVTYDVVPPAEVPTPVPDPDTIVSFVDTNNLIVGPETGVPSQYYYESPMSSGELYVEYSAPQNKTAGIEYLDKIVLYWNENIQDRFIDEIKVKKTKLPFETDLFADHSVAIGTRVIANHKLTLQMFETGAGVTDNFEYTVEIPQGAVARSTDLSLRNAYTVIKFSGLLSPLFATPDAVKILISSDLSGSDIHIDDYDLLKKIQIISQELLSMLGETPDPADPIYFWIVRYVTCRIAYEIIRGPLDVQKYLTSRNVLGQSVTWGINRTADDKSPLRQCIEKALQELGLFEGPASPQIGVKSADTSYYRGRERQDTIEESELRGLV